ncbi:flagellar hook capping FlgD N-terminal domain-containing protein [Ferrovibrio sp.]|uniref:flagellar hook assembly protein FlgD n=1 Tax=Ferrovibrio sp. TaxID=1917215 RepID=UPI00260DFD35|nr:flagellar hook capping FlgD N-terminal domain-containing protein [Ferrovibrio sp.]
MVSSVTDTTGTTNTVSNTAASKLAGDFDTFLTLLTTQLKNQDPTSPMDPNEFTQQLVQFSQVEQQINMNKNLEKMISMLQAGQNSTNLNFIGKVVDVDDKQVKLAEGGSAFWSYELPKGVMGVQYNILDSSGKVVRTVNVTSDQASGFKPGRVEVAWDGKDGQGNAMAAGTYKLEVVGKDANGKSVDGVKVYARGYVEALETVDGQQYLVVSGSKYLPEKVVSVFAPPQDNSGSGSTT